MSYNSGFEEHANRKDLPLISSGDAMLDELLEGGFQKDLIYLLIGDRKSTSKILVSTSVAAFADENFNKRVGFVDGNNRFNHYHISKLAASRRLSPKIVLDRNVNVLNNYMIQYYGKLSSVPVRVKKLKIVYYLKTVDCCIKKKLSC